MEDDMKLKDDNLSKYFELINNKERDVIILSGHGSKSINDNISKALGILTTGMYIKKHNL
jgi:hypothetical protein